MHVEKNKQIPGRMLGQNRPDKNSAICLIRAARFRVLESHRSTRPTRTSYKSERGALVRGSDPPLGHSVHTTAGVMWRAPARRLIKRVGPIRLRWQTIDFFSGFARRLIKRVGPIRLRWQTIVFFSGFGEERRTPRATSRPLDHGST